MTLAEGDFAVLGFLLLRPMTGYEVKAMMDATIGHFNRAFSHLSDVLYSGIVSTVNTVNPLFASTGGVYSPKTNWASPVYIGEEWQYGGYPYYTDEQMGPISNRCG